MLGLLVRFTSATEQNSQQNFSNQMKEEEFKGQVVFIEVTWRFQGENWKEKINLGDLGQG
jgi:hypothetical protein